MIDKIGARCTGCYSCVNICPKGCIHMKDHADGFWYPEIDPAVCIGCNLCETHCPVLHPFPIEKTEADVKVYALIHKNEAVRSSSSSGGAFSAIADHVLEQGGAVFGAAFGENFEILHTSAETKEELSKLRGSKYVQSRIGETYRLAKSMLDAGRPVLFSGTACQTSGLLAYLGRDYDNLLTQDLICHGVPSPLAWRKYLKMHEQLRRSQIRSVFFRDKRFGWHDWHVAIRFENGEEYTENQREDMLIKSFLRGKCSRECCYDCPFKQKVRLADFTLADFWGIEKLSPELDDDKGISSVYVNSPKAARVIEAIRDRVTLREMELNTAVSGNMAMVESEKVHPDRERFLRELPRKSFDLLSGEFNDEIGVRTKVTWTIRRLLGIRVYEKIRNLISRG